MQRSPCSFMNNERKRRTSTNRLTMLVFSFPELLHGEASKLHKGGYVGGCLWDYIREYYKGY